MILCRVSRLVLAAVIFSATVLVGLAMCLGTPIDGGNFK